MGLDKAIQAGKEHRHGYYRSGACDLTCRPGGSCPYCHEARFFNEKRRKFNADEQIKEWES